MSDTARLEQDIQATRARLEGTINELAYRAQPQVIAQRQAQGLRLKLDAATHTDDGRAAHRAHRGRRRGGRGRRRASSASCAADAEGCCPGARACRAAGVSRGAPEQADEGRSRPHRLGR